MTPDDRDIARETLERARKVGGLDEHVIEGVDLLNALDGVTTEYSCHGHKDERSPTAFVVLILDPKLSDELYRHRRTFLRDAPFPLTLEFRYQWLNPTNKPHELVDPSGRVWVSGDVANIGPNCAPMFSYLTAYLDALIQLDKEIGHG